MTECHVSYDHQRRCYICIIVTAPHSYQEFRPVPLTLAKGPVNDLIRFLQDNDWPSEAAPQLATLLRQRKEHEAAQAYQASPQAFVARIAKALHCTVPEAQGLAQDLPYRELVAMTKDVESLP